MSKRRTWRKLHLGVDEATGEIVVIVVTANHVADGEVLEDLLEQIEGKLNKFQPMVLMTIAIAMTRLMPKEPKP